MNKLTTAKRVAVVAALVEGNSIRSTVRMTNVSKPTILKLLADLGRACAKFQGEAIVGVRARRVQVGINRPPTKTADATFKKAPKAKGKIERAAKLPDLDV